MPNWCFSRVQITGPENEIKVLNDEFEKAFKIDQVENSWGKTWLGNLVLHLKKDWQEIPCRGEICYYDHSEPDKISLDVETAWAPLLRPIILMVDEYAPNADIIYTAEEPGCCLFVSNDPEVAGRICIETEEEDLEDYELWGLTKDQYKDMMIDALTKRKNYKITEGDYGLPALEMVFAKEYTIFLSEYSYCDINEL